MSTENLLRTELRAWADEVDPDTSRDMSAAGLTDLRRRRLRHRAELLAAAALVVAVLLGVQAGTSRLFTGPDPAPAAPVAAPPIDLFGLPARGPLADDPAALAALVQRPWVGTGAEAGRDPEVSGIPDPPVESRRVLWAGDSPSGLRLAVVAGVNNAQPAERDPDLQSDLGALGSAAVAVFAGPAGTPVERLGMVGIPRGRIDGRPFAVRDAATGTALVLAEPGDYIEIARRPEYAADGTQSWTFEPVEAADGAALLATDHGYAMRARIWRDGGLITTVEGFDTFSSDPGGPGEMESIATGVDVRALRPPVDPAGTEGVVDDVDVAHLVMTSGLPPDQVDVVVPWTGIVPSRDGIPTTATLTTAELPSSAVLLSVTWWRPLRDGARGGSGCGDDWHTTVLPGGVPVEDRTFAFRCTTHDMSGSSGSGLTSLVVVAPVGSTAARLYDESGALLDELALTDGVVVTTDDALVSGTASVVALRADGTPHDRAGLLPGG